VVCSFTNETGFTNGNILIGLNDLFDSVGVRGLSGNFVLFDNVRVVSCAPAIAALALTPAGQVQIDFVSPAGGEPHEFHLESAAQLTPAAWQQEIDASVSTVFGGFRAVAPRKDGAQNYRIRRDPPAAMPGP